MESLDQKLLSFFRRARQRRRLHLSGIDPCSYSLDNIAHVVTEATRAGTDAFLLGGSTDVDGILVENFAARMREALDRFGPERPPIILFPSSAQSGVARSADAVLFLCLLNSSDVRFLIREQAAAAPILGKIGLDAIGCGMIVVEPGQTVGRVGKADLVARNDGRTALGYAMAAERFGFPMLYLNAGSGSPTPVPEEIVRLVAGAVRVPLIVGGGITDADLARRAALAGADIIITGTALEDTADVRAAVAEIADAVHGVPPAERAGAG